MLLLLFRGVAGEVIPPTPPTSTGGTGGSDPGEARRPLAESTQGLQIRRAPRAKPDIGIPISEVSEIQPVTAQEYVAAQRANPAMAEAMARIQDQIAAARQAELDATAAEQALAAQAEMERQTQIMLAIVLEQQRRQADDELALVLLMAD